MGRPAQHDLSKTLTAAERAALQQLADAYHAVVARWPVGRVVNRALRQRGLVDGCSEWVWITDSGRQALAASTATDDTA